MWGERLSGRGKGLSIGGGGADMPAIVEERNSVSLSTIGVFFLTRKRKWVRREGCGRVLALGNQKKGH